MGDVDPNASDLADFDQVDPSCGPPNRSGEECSIAPQAGIYRQRARFDASFAALSDATRRGVLEQLALSDASITHLAKMFHITLTGMSKHINVLVRAGLVTTEKVGRVRICRLGMVRLEEEVAWIEHFRRLSDAYLDAPDMAVRAPCNDQKDR